MTEGDEPIEIVNNFEGEDEDIEDDNDDDSWDEMGEADEAEPTKCLFCDKVDSSIEKSIQHLDQQHRINLNGIKNKFNLDQYSYIKVKLLMSEQNRAVQFIPYFRTFQMINYIKTHKITADNFLSMNQVLWNDDAYLKPVDVDAWLMFGML